MFLFLIINCSVPVPNYYLFLFPGLCKHYIRQSWGINLSSSAGKMATVSYHGKKQTINILFVLSSPQININSSLFPKTLYERAHVLRPRKLRNIDFNKNKKKQEVFLFVSNIYSMFLLRIWALSSSRDGGGGDLCTIYCKSV